MWQMVLIWGKHSVQQTHPTSQFKVTLSRGEAISFKKLMGKEEKVNGEKNGGTEDGEEEKEDETENNLFDQSKKYHHFCHVATYC